ncbi:Modification methylase ScrFIA [Symbiodinium microadriaticum]|uniref:Cytosine-specific methyltransferase n=1 Tax=Symbiodinium microadriaticum TaxID=2951 RepID=A0A1Q9EQW7_SYMMI|nr:Modification methylase ScrFIA [Symbiodinium microadriaticum]
MGSQADGRWGTGPEQAWEAQGPLPLHVLPPVGSLDHPKANASLGSGGRPGPSENLLEQFHIGATLTGSAQADYRSTMEQFGNWETPMHVPQSFPLQVGAAPVPNCPPSSESVMWIDKRQNADVQAEHQRIFGEMDPFLSSKQRMLPGDESSAGLRKEGLRKRARVAGPGDSASASDGPEEAVRDYEGRKAVHLTIEGAAFLSAGEAVRDYEGRKAVHLTIEGAAFLSAGEAEAASFTFIELFAGVGGFRHGLEPLGGQCVFASEIDVDCQEAYAANFGSNELFGDITMIPSEDLPRHDLLTAGFPCQPFSRRGERRGFEDARGELFFEIVRALDACRPKAFLLENVWNMQFLDGGHWDADPAKCLNGEVYTRVLRCLEEVGYAVQTAQLNSECWVPQKRARLYFVGIRSDMKDAFTRFCWPTGPSERKLQEVLEPDGSLEVIRSELSESQWTAVQKSSTWARGGESLRFAKLDGTAGTLTASYKSSYACTAELLAPVNGKLSRPRFFTRREFARLMGFPEDHVFANPHSENRAYHQLGNAVCPPVITAIARSLLHALGMHHSLPAGSAVEQNCPAQNLKQQGFHGEYYQQVVTEIAKQLPGVDASLERGYTGPMLPPVAPPPVVPPVVPPVAASPVAPLAPPKNLDGVAPGSSSRSREWSPRDPRAEERMEELHRYIRNQANDFAEGKAEWSRQLAEAQAFMTQMQAENMELKKEIRRLKTMNVVLQQTIGSQLQGFPGLQLAGGTAAPTTRLAQACGALKTRAQELEAEIAKKGEQKLQMQSDLEKKKATLQAAMSTTPAKSSSPPQLTPTSETGTVPSNISQLSRREVALLLQQVRSESLREVEKVRREKAELECQARRELARLKHRIKELGGGEEGFSLRALPSDASEQLAPWAAMVGFEEHQQVQKRCAAAEDRIQELEQYIKASRQESESMESSSKDEVPKLRQTVHMLQQELQQAAAELQALRVHHHQKVSFWEQGARRLLGFADQFFSLNGRAPFGSGNEATSGQTRFEKTATKVLVTMPSTDQDGNDVAALQRMLKDVLKNPPKEAAKKAAKEKTGSEGEGEPEEASNAEDLAPRDEEVHSYGGASCKVIRPPNGKQGARP